MPSTLMMIGLFPKEKTDLLFFVLKKKHVFSTKRSYTTIICRICFVDAGNGVFWVHVVFFSC